MNEIRWVGDGSEGWEQFAPYDRIITTAAAETMPQRIIEQLKTKPGGIAVGDCYPYQPRQPLALRAHTGRNAAVPARNIAPAA